MTVEIPTSAHGKIRITNLYIPPTNSADEEHISTDNWPSKNHVLILGDFNAHSLLWDDNTRDGTPDRRGKKIEDWLAETGMACINSGEPTFVSRSNGRETAPDISLLHSSLLDKVTWKTSNKLGSDHKPIIITYEGEMIRVNQKAKLKWKLETADWEKYTNDVESKIPKEYSRMNINKLICQKEY